MALLIALNALVFLFLGIIWTRNSTLNVSLKAFCWLMFFANGFVMMQMSGYVIVLHK